MDSFSIGSRALGLLLLFCMSPIEAHEPEGARFPHGVATIDVARVYKECQWFHNEMDLLKTELSDYQQYLEGQKAYLDEVTTEIDNTTDPTRKEALQLEVATLKADVSLETKQKKTDLLEREKVLYEDLMELVTEEIASFAELHHLSLVAKDNQSLERDTRKDVNDYVNRDTLYAAKGIDITDDIIARVNQRLAAPAASSDDNAVAAE